MSDTQLTKADIVIKEEPPDYDEHGYEEVMVKIEPMDEGNEQLSQNNRDTISDEVTDNEVSGNAEYFGNSSLLEMKKLNNRIDEDFFKETLPQPVPEIRVEPNPNYGTTTKKYNKKDMPFLKILAAPSGKNYTLFELMQQYDFRCGKPSLFQPNTMNFWMEKTLYQVMKLYNIRVGKGNIPYKFYQTLLKIAPFLSVDDILELKRSVHKLVTTDQGFSIIEQKLNKDKPVDYVPKFNLYKKIEAELWESITSTLVKKEYDKMLQQRKTTDTCMDTPAIDGKANVDKTSPVPGPVEECYLCNDMIHEESFAVHLQQEHIDWESLGKENQLGSQDFVCSHCFSGDSQDQCFFPTSRDLKCHELGVHLGKSSCYFCGLTVNSEDDNMKHVVSAHSWVLQCRVCKQDFCTKDDSFYQHGCFVEGFRHAVEVSHSYVCLYCNIKFNKPDILYQHIGNKHPLNDRKEMEGVICYSCKGLFLDEEAVRFHRSKLAVIALMAPKLSSEKMNHIRVEMSMLLNILAPTDSKLSSKSQPPSPATSRIKLHKISIRGQEYEYSPKMFIHTLNLADMDEQKSSLVIKLLLLQFLNTYPALLGKRTRGMDLKMKNLIRIFSRTEEFEQTLIKNGLGPLSEDKELMTFYSRFRRLYGNRHKSVLNAEDVIRARLGTCQYGKNFFGSSTKPTAKEILRDRLNALSNDTSPTATATSSTITSLPSTSSETSVTSASASSTPSVAATNMQAVSTASASLAGNTIIINNQQGGSNTIILAGSHMGTGFTLPSSTGLVPIQASLGQSQVLSPHLLNQATQFLSSGNHAGNPASAIINQGAQALNQGTLLASHPVFFCPTSAGGFSGQLVFPHPNLINAEVAGVQAQKPTKPTLAVAPSQPSANRKVEDKKPCLPIAPHNTLQTSAEGSLQKKENEKFEQEAKISVDIKKDEKEIKDEKVFSDQKLHIDLEIDYDDEDEDTEDADTEDDDCNDDTESDDPEYIPYADFSKRKFSHGDKRDKPLSRRSKRLKCVKQEIVCVDHKTESTKNEGPKKNALRKQSLGEENIEMDTQELRIKTTDIRTIKPEAFENQNLLKGTTFDDIKPAERDVKRSKTQKGRERDSDLCKQHRMKHCSVVLVKHTEAENIASKLLVSALYGDKASTECTNVPYPIVDSQGCKTETSSEAKPLKMNKNSGSDQSKVSAVADQQLQQGKLNLKPKETISCTKPIVSVKDSNSLYVYAGAGQQLKAPDAGLGQDLPVPGNSSENTIMVSTAFPSLVAGVPHALFVQSTPSGTCPSFASMSCPGFVEIAPKISLSSLPICSISNLSQLPANTSSQSSFGLPSTASLSNSAGPSNGGIASQCNMTPIPSTSFATWQQIQPSHSGVAGSSDVQQQLGISQRVRLTPMQISQLLIGPELLQMDRIDPRIRSKVEKKVRDMTNEAIRTLLLDLNPQLQKDKQSPEKHIALQEEILDRILDALRVLGELEGNAASRSKVYRLYIFTLTEKLKQRYEKKLKYVLAILQYKPTQRAVVLEKYEKKQHQLKDLSYKAAKKMLEEYPKKSDSKSSHQDPSHLLQKSLPVTVQKESQQLNQIQTQSVPSTWQTNLLPCSSQNNVENLKCALQMSGPSNWQTTIAPCSSHNIVDKPMCATPQSQSYPVLIHSLSKPSQPLLLSANQQQQTQLPQQTVTWPLLATSQTPQSLAQQLISTGSVSSLQHGLQMPLQQQQQQQQALANLQQNLSLPLISNQQQQQQQQLNQSLFLLPPVQNPLSSQQQLVIQQFPTTFQLPLSNPQPDQLQSQLAQSCQLQQQNLLQQLQQQHFLQTLQSQQQNLQQFQALQQPQVHQLSSVSSQVQQQHQLPFGIPQQLVLPQITQFPAIRPQPPQQQVQQQFWSPTSPIPTSCVVQQSATQLLSRQPVLLVGNSLIIPTPASTMSTSSSTATTMSALSSNPICNTTFGSSGQNAGTMIKIEPRPINDDTQPDMSITNAGSAVQMIKQEPQDEGDEEKSNRQLVITVKEEPTDV